MDRHNEMFTKSSTWLNEYIKYDNVIFFYVFSFASPSIFYTRAQFSCFLISGLLVVSSIYLILQHFARAMYNFIFFFAHVTLLVRNTYEQGWWIYNCILNFFYYIYNMNIVCTMNGRICPLTSYLDLNSLEDEIVFNIPKKL